MDVHHASGVLSRGSVENMSDESCTIWPDKLDRLFEMQYEFGSKFCDFPTVGVQESQQKTMEYINHTIEELFEMRREMPIRKHWSTKMNQIPNWNKAKEEYVDALHFFISIALINGWSANDIFIAYCDKHKLNEQRQKEGY